MNNKYCVYFHRDKNGKVFYVGHGTLKRAYNSTQRTDIWKELSDGFSVEIFKCDRTKKEAIDIEEQQILLLNPSTNIMKSGRYVEYCLDFLKTYFKLDASSPSGISWNINIYGGRNNKQIFKKIGQPAGSVDYGRNGEPSSWRLYLNGKRYQAHRVVWMLYNCCEIDSELVIDHLDGNPLNNSIENLELKTVYDNNRNRKITSKHAGVTEMFSRDGSKLYTYRTSWTDLDGKRHHKDFNISEFGDKALDLAKEFRLLKLLELRENGAKYTDRHLGLQVS